MIQLHIINLIQLLTLTGFMCYYIGKGRITITKRMSRKEEEKIKQQQKELENTVNARIAAIQDFNDGLD